MAVGGFFESILSTFFMSENWTVEDILSIIMILLSIAGGIFAYRQWTTSNKTKRTELIKQVVEQLRFDKEMVDTMYLLEYDDMWYDDGFHNRNDDLEYRIDKLLSYLSYICYLKTEKHISNKEFRILRYEVNRVCTSPFVQSYLWNLYHFSQEEGVDCSFQYLIDYGISNKLIDQSFLKADCCLYEKTLNF